MGAHPDITDYQVVQTSPQALTLFLPQEEHWTAAAEALHQEIERHGASGVTLDRASQKIHDHGSKLRRIMTKKSG